MLDNDCQTIYGPTIFDDPAVARESSVVSDESMQAAGSLLPHAPQTVLA
jgi:hypothetical protein